VITIPESLEVEDWNPSKTLREEDIAKVGREMIFLSIAISF
jgi:hypothetical protein